MREALDPWIFVNVTYAIGIAGTLGMIAWSWFEMRRAERRRDELRRK